MRHKTNGDINCNWRSWNDTQRFGKGTGRVGYMSTSRDHHFNIFMIGKNTGRFQETWWDLLLFSLQWKTTSKRRWEKLVRNKTINYIISECCKLAQKEYKIRYDWVGKVIHCELCKKFKFDPTNNWYMHSPESFPENEMHKLLWDFEIQTNHLS